tara:strand:+ start:152 stop:856 length:705 start_codon:yes stop_codon:yes gene_type:complete
MSPSREKKWGSLSWVLKANLMKRSFSVLAVSMMFFGTGCFHPVSTMFETAHSLDKGDTRVTLGGTINPESESSYSGGSFLGIVDHGIAEKIDLRLRLERREETGDFSAPYNYLEVGSKWSFGNDWAFSLPVQVYLLDGDESLFFLNPRFMFSRRTSNREVTGVVHAKTGVIDGGFGVIPGAALGLTLGDDFDETALRLEMGYNLLNQITFGLGWQFQIGQRSISLQQGRESSDE